MRVCAPLQRALDTMGLSTHLMGRRLVLQWAKEDDTVDELRQKTAQQLSVVQSLGELLWDMGYWAYRDCVALAVYN